MKSFSFKAKCPYCDKINSFFVYAEEVKNDYHFSCSFCEQETQLSKYKIIEEKEVLK